jgi:hypothetical protein
MKLLLCLLALALCSCSRSGYIGIVSEIKETRSSVLIDLDGNYPNQKMIFFVPLETAKQWRSVHPNGWPKRGTMVTASGTVMEYKGRREIVINDPAQVSW